MHIAVLCGSYDPKPSAVAICARNLVRELKSKQHDVSVILPYDGNPSSEDNIIRFKEPDYIRYYSNSRLLRFYVRIKRYLLAFVKKSNINEQAIRGYINALKLLHKKKQIDIIVPFSFPFESVISAVKFRDSINDYIRIYPIIFDNFVENKSLHRAYINCALKKKNHIALSKSVLGGCDHIFVIHSQKLFFEKTIPNLLNKISFIEHPLLVPPKGRIISNGHMLYTGTFLKGYVKSKELADLLEKIIHLINCKIDFCVMGNDTGNIEALAKQFPAQVLYHGRVPFSTAESFIAQASILISVSEVSGIQISSKIFTYMSCGKPIIQFYFRDEDINCSILSKYPLAYSFKLRQNGKYTVDEIENLIAFIKNNTKKMLPFKAVANIYPEACPNNLALLLTASV